MIQFANIASKIRHLAISLHGNRLAAAEFENRIHVWDLKQHAPVCSFDGKLDFGGKRLAITNCGEFVVAGCYNRYGLACYESSSGREIWRRKDIKQVQYVTIDPSDRFIYCGMEGPCVQLSLRNGETITKLKGIQRVLCHPNGAAYLLEGKKLLFQVPLGKTVTKIDRETFAVLDAAFSKTIVVIAESGGSVRAIHCPTGEEKWRYDPASGSHILELAYSMKQKKFMGVEWPYERGGPKQLLGFDQESGNTSVIVPKLSQATLHEFCSAGEQLLNSEGELLDTATGKVIEYLKFPR